MGRMGKHYHSWFCAFLDLWSAPNVRFGMDTRVRLAGTLRWSWRTGQVGMFSYEQHSFGNQDQSFPRLSNSVPSACVTFTSLPEHLYVPRAAEGMRRGEGSNGRDASAAAADVAVRRNRHVVRCTPPPPPPGPGHPGFAPKKCYYWRWSTLEVTTSTAFAPHIHHK